MTPKLFSELGLSPEMLKAIERLGFEQAAPIQAEAIPVIQSGRDVFGQSQTGSGKTAAFAIPAIEKVDTKNRAVQVLILCPTRELAVQVSEEVHKLAFFKPGIRALPVYGGQSYERQFAGLKAGANIVIGTPGRVMDHMNRGTLRLDQIHTIILDEADEMLDMGFREDIEFVLKAMPAERQTVLFSATVPPPIEHLIRNYTRDAVRVQIAAKALTVPTVEQVYYEVDRRWKIEALTRLIELHNVTLGIIFCNTQRMVDELTEHLHAAGYSADALHGGLAQAARDRVMKKFRTGSLEFLVATDVAARGIDVDDIQVVFNYDLPYDAEDYVHRIGRTGRAGRSGLAITFVSGREFFMIRQIEQFTRQRLRRGEIPTEGEIERAKEDQLLQRVRATLQAKDFPRRDHFIEALLEEGFDSVAIASATLHLLTGGEDAEPGKPEPKGTPGRPALAAPAALKPAVVAKPAIVAKPAVAERPPVAPKPMAQPKPEPARAKTPKLLAPPETAPAPAFTVEEEAGFPEGEGSPATAVVNPVPVVAAVETTPAPSAGEPAAAPVPAAPTPVAPKAPARKPVAPAAPQPPRPQVRASTWDRPAFAEPRPQYRDRPDSYQRPPEPNREWDRTASYPQREFREPRPDNRYNERPPQRPMAAAPLRPEPKPVAKPVSMSQVWLGIGQRENVSRPDVVTCIQGHTGLPDSVIGQIEVHEEHTLVDVNSEFARNVVLKLKHGVFNGKPLRAKLANR
ncbi:MAG TPA: DEAD/DEAH box helicase [Candidatus Limnocylindria bacterium]|nr:DEAD/DEAH box helicase [Candidatus Limnocylindria bacterium]